MEEHPKNPRCSHRMQRFPPLPPQATLSHHKNNKTQTTKNVSLEATPSGTTSEFNQLESSLPISNEPKITSLPISESEAVETEAHETLEHEVIEPEFVYLDTLQLDFMQLKEPQIIELVTSGTYLSLPLPLFQPQPVHFSTLR